MCVKNKVCMRKIKFEKNRVYEEGCTKFVREKQIWYEKYNACMRKVKFVGEEYSLY